MCIRDSDKTADVMKTFNDYSEEADIQFIQLTIPENHLWCGHKLKDLTLPPETLIVLIRRGEQNIIPVSYTHLDVYKRQAPGY